MNTLPRSSRARRAAQLATLTLGHLVVDMYAGFVQPLIPGLRDRLEVRLAMITLLAGVAQIVVNAVQPFAGLIVSRFRWPVFLILGPALAILLAGLGLPTTYAGLFAVVLVGHVGIGIFHPDGLVAAHDVAGSRGHVGVPMFLSGGYLGMSLGAWISTQWYYHYRFDRFWLLGIPGVVLLALMLLAGLNRLDSAAATRRPDYAVGAGGTNFFVLQILAIVTVVATAVQFMFFNVHMEAQWGDEGIKWGGRALGVVGLTGAIGSYGWGWLSARRSMFALIAVGQVLCVPAYLMMIHVGIGPALIAWSVPTGVLLGGSVFPLIATAARWSPQLTPTLRAGLIIGGSWGATSLIAMGCGWLTDFGVTAEQILRAMVVPMLIAAVLAAWLHLRARRIARTGTAP